MFIITYNLSNNYLLNIYIIKRLYKMVYNYIYIYFNNIYQLYNSNI